MARTRPVDYAGAAGRITLEAARELGERWVLQPKVDGALVRVHLDRRGRIARILTRSGVDAPRSLTAHLLGALVGWPGSELVGEIEAYTEAGNRLAACRGWRQVHLFDVIRAGDRYVAREPYRTRRDLLWRMQSEVVNLGVELPWYEDDHGARSRSSGRFVAGVPTDWRLTPIVAQRPAHRAEEAWAEVERDDAEGLVVVALDAPMGARRSKLKIKKAAELDCRVVEASRGVLLVEWRGIRFAIAAGAKTDAHRAGDVVEVRHSGWYERTTTPRHAVLVRARPDLALR